MFMYKRRVKAISETGVVDLAKTRKCLEFTWIERYEFTATIWDAPLSRLGYVTPPFIQGSMPSKTGLPGLRLMIHAHAPA